MPKCSILTHVQFALRWRTEEEVLSGTGESSCGNTRCKHHNVNSFVPSLSTLELPFAYEEQGETKSALVKTVLDVLVHALRRQEVVQGDHLDHFLNFLRDIISLGRA